VNSHSRSVSFVLALTLFGGVFNGASAQSEPEGGKRAIVVEERRQGTAVYPTTVSGTPLTAARTGPARDGGGVAGRFVTWLGPPL